MALIAFGQGESIKKIYFAAELRVPLQALVGIGFKFLQP